MKSELLKVAENKTIKVTSDAQYIILVEDYFKENAIEVELLFEKEGVSAEIVVVYNVPVKGNMNVTTIAHHVVPNTSCLTKVKGILNDKSSSQYVGKILIDKNAQQTSSFLQDDVLVIGKDTKNNSQPILMIEANDVKASHGATTGRINEDEIYYLQTRGFDRDTAQKLIVQGFLNSLISQIYDESIQKEVAREVLGDIDLHDVA